MAVDTPATADDTETALGVTGISSYRDIVCPDATYHALCAAGVDKIVAKRRNDIAEFFLYNGYGDAAEALRKECFKAVRSSRDTKVPADDVLTFFQAMDDHNDNNNHIHARMLEGTMERILLANPGALARLVLGNDVPRWQDYGFANKRRFERSLVSYCLQEYDTIMWPKEQHAWRRAGRRNSISNTMHGEVRVGQHDVSGSARTTQTLWGETQELPTHKTADYRGLAANDHTWTPWLWTVLRYTEAVTRRDNPLVTDWTSVCLRAGGGRGTATAEAEFGSDLPPWILEQYLRVGLLRKGEPVTRDVILMDNGYSGNVLYLPYLEDRCLHVAVTETDGPLRFDDARYPAGRRLRDVLVFDEGDLPDLLAGTYRFFGRNRRHLPIFIDAFLHPDHYRLDADTMRPRRP